jgi:hypothetical protein
MMPIEPTKLLRLYDQGHFTPMELQCRLVQSAARYSPETFASLMPAKVLEAIRELAESPPESWEGCPRIFAISTCVSQYDSEAEERQERQLWYDGIWCWHSFFNRS